MDPVYNNPDFFSWYEKNWVKEEVPVENIMFKYDENGYPSKAMIFFTKDNVEVKVGIYKNKQMVVSRRCNNYRFNIAFIFVQDRNNLLRL